MSNRNYSEDGYSAAAPVIELYTAPNEMVTNGERTYYVMVLKKYLDMLEHGELCMRSVFEKMHHGMTIPGTRLLSSPFRFPGGKQILPQFADAYEVPLHAKGCKSYSKAHCPEEKLRKYEDAVKESAATIGLSFDAACVCADPVQLRDIKCTCFRSMPAAMVKGSRLSKTQRQSMEMQMHTNLQDAGVRDLEFVQLNRPAEDLAFEEYLSTKLLWTPDRIRVLETGLYTEEAMRYHPSMSTAVALTKEQNEALGDRVYPSTFVSKYLEGFKDMMERSCTLITAARTADSESIARLQRLGTSILPEEDVRALSHTRKKILEATTTPLNELVESMGHDHTWDKFSSEVCQIVGAETWETVEVHMRRMTAAQRQAWLRLDATPVVAVDHMISLMSKVQKTINESKKMHNRTARG